MEGWASLVIRASNAMGQNVVLGKRAAWNALTSDLFLRRRAKLHNLPEDLLQLVKLATDGDLGALEILPASLDQDGWVIGAATLPLRSRFSSVVLTTMNPCWEPVCNPSNKKSPRR